jgi:hypothetical protein
LALTDLNTQILMLAQSPQFVQAAGAPLTAAVGGEVIGFGPTSTGQTVVTGFDPTKDILQLSLSQFANVAAVLAAEQTTVGGLLITQPGTGYSILLHGLTTASLVPADMRFT